MNWSDISGTIGKYAPLVGTLVGGPAGAAIGATVAAALGTQNTPAAVSAALTSPENSEAVSKLREVQETNKNQYNMMVLEVQKQQIAQQGQVMIAELGTEDKFKSYWRPCFGYALALSFLIFTCAFAYLLVKLVGNPTGMSETITSVSMLMPSILGIWGVALTVLGINVKSRSGDKQVQATGQAPKSMLEKLSGMFGGKKE